MDKFVWRWMASGEYLATSTYEAFFHRRVYMPGGKQFWKIRAPLKCNFFLWIVMCKRCWVSKSLQTWPERWWQVALCDHELETMDHLLLASLVVINKEQRQMILWMTGGFNLGRGWQSHWEEVSIHMSFSRPRQFGRNKTIVSWATKAANRKALSTMCNSALGSGMYPWRRR